MAEAMEIQEDATIDSMDEDEDLRIAETVERSVPLGQVFRSFFKDDWESILTEANDAPLWRKSFIQNVVGGERLSGSESYPWYSDEEVRECTNISDEILAQYIKAEVYDAEIALKRKANQSQGGGNNQGANGVIPQANDCWRSQA